MSFLEDFQANLESLPNILQRKYALLRDLDKSLQEVQRQNEQRCDQEIEEMKREINSGNLAPDASKLRFSDEVVDEQKHAIRIADEKVALASQAYELVDSHIQQLDQYLKKYDEDLRRDRESVATTGSSVQNVDSNNKPTKGSESGRGGRKKTRLGATTAATSAAAANPTSMDLDLPVDPNEPTYCFCNQVSYGEMVACDNPDVHRRQVNLSHTSTCSTDFLSDQQHFAVDHNFSCHGYLLLVAVYCCRLLLLW